MRTFLILFSLLFCTINSNALTFSENNGIAGIVTEDNGDPVIYGSLTLYKNGILYHQTETDMEGKYSFNNIDPGMYDLEISYIGFSSKIITGILVKDDIINLVNIEMSGGICCCCEMVSIGYQIPLIELDGLTSGQTWSSHQIKRFPSTRN